MHTIDHFLLDACIDGQEISGRVKRRGLALGERIDTDDDLLATFDSTRTLSHRTD